VSAPQHDAVNGASSGAASAWNEHVAAAREVIAAAEREQATLRLLGSVGCRLHCGGHEAVFDALEREDPPDLDFVAPRRSRASIRKVFADLGFDEDRDMTVAMEGRRYKYQRSADGLTADLFIDRLEFCHPIDVSGRFDLDEPTLSLADLVLSKLQIVEINRKDLTDLTVLLLAHDLGDGREKVDAAYIAGLAAADWGLCYTMGRTLERLHAYVETASLDARTKTTVRGRADALRAAVDSRPKSLRWKLRAKVGPRMQWYQDVSEPEPTF